VPDDVPPAWLASMVQVPAASKVTTPPLIEQTSADVEATLKVTARPEVLDATGV